EAEGGLDGLRATRKQLDVRNAFGQQLADQVEEAGTGLGREAAEGEMAELLVETFQIMRMTVSDAADRDTGNEVQVFIPIHVDDDAAFGAIHHDLRVEGNRLQAWRHRFGLAIEDRFRFRPRHDALLADAALAVAWRGPDTTRSDVVHGSTPRCGHD